MPNPSIKISIVEAKRIIDKGISLTDSIISEDLIIESGSEWNKKITIENCIIENLSCIMVQFHQRLTIRNSYIKNASFNFSYFIGGLTIDNCIFDEYLDFEAGGHNNPGNFVMIKGNHFKSFVNFFDCWFTGEVSIDNNIFENGTNILSKNQLVSFDIPFQIEKNVGDLNVESENRNKER